MDSSNISGGKSSKRELQLQGPRPAPLRVNKDSHKIKKPPLAPPHPSQPPVQLRPPVIIYTVSPKIIHTKPSDFMTLVQRLTGLSSSSSCSSSSQAPSSNPLINSGAISPAACYATIEKARDFPEAKKQQVGEVGSVGGIEMDHQGVERMGPFPGILSPGPASLPPIPSNFFSPPSDPSPFSFLHDLSPVLHGGKNYLEGSFMLSPSNFFSPYMTSPSTAPSIDLFPNLFDN
jgi:hypothetical protein